MSDSKILTNIKNRQLIPPGVRTLLMWFGLIAIIVVVSLMIFLGNKTDSESEQESEQESDLNLNDRTRINLETNEYNDVSNLDELTQLNYGVLRIGIPNHKGFRLACTIKINKISNVKVMDINNNISVMLNNNNTGTVNMNYKSYNFPLKVNSDNIILDLYQNQSGYIWVNGEKITDQLSVIRGNSHDIKIYPYKNIKYTFLHYTKW